MAKANTISGKRAKEDSPKLEEEIEKTRKAVESIGDGKSIRWEEIRDNYLQ